MFTYNSTKHTLIGYSVFMLMYGLQSRAPIDVMIHQDINQMLHITKENVKTSQDRARFYVDHDRHACVHNIVGQKVFL